MVFIDQKLLKTFIVNPNQWKNSVFFKTKVPTPFLNNSTNTSRFHQTTRNTFSNPISINIQLSFRLLHIQPTQILPWPLHYWVFLWLFEILRSAIFRLFIVKNSDEKSSKGRLTKVKLIKNINVIESCGVLHLPR